MTRVVVMLVELRTPRASMHRCAASTATSTPHPPPSDPSPSVDSPVGPSSAPMRSRRDPMRSVASAAGVSVTAATACAICR
eukprot:661264-Prorocentrum_minimum.AAC.1